MIKENEFKELVKDIDIDLLGCVNNLRSMSKTIDIYEYHKSEAYRLIKEIEPKSHLEKMKFVWQPSKEMRRKKLLIQAHIQAAIYNSRALYDIFSHLINKVVLDGKIKVNYCSIDKVLNHLPAGSLKAALDLSIRTDAYLYVNAFVNTIKHRDLVETSSSIDFVNNRFGIKFIGFNYKEKPFDSLWAIDVLERSFNVKNNVIDLFKVFKNGLVEGFV